MSKNKLFSFVLAVAVLVIALPTEAQSRRRGGGGRNGGSRSSQQSSYQNRSNVPYDQSNAAYGYDTPDRGHHQATQNNVNLWGALNLVATGAGTYWNRRNDNKHHDQEMEASNQQAQTMALLLQLQQAQRYQQPPQQYPTRARRYENPPQQDEPQVNEEMEIGLEVVVEREQEVARPRRQPQRQTPLVVENFYTNKTGECVWVDKKPFAEGETRQALSGVKALHITQAASSKCKSIVSYKTSSSGGKTTYDLLCVR